MSDKNRIIIFDTTMRDGEQSPGASMSLEEKLQISRVFDELGVDIIEAGFPIASPGDYEAVTEISKTLKKSIPAGLARATKKDIDACHDALKHAKNFRIHTFISTSPLHMKHKLNKSPEEVLDAIKESVSYARKFTDDVEWSCEDGTRTDMDYMCKTVELAIKSGAKTINIPDTVGYTVPSEFKKIIETLINKVPNIDKAILSTHCHNDLGLAVANSLAGVTAGARQIECTINGIGERAGNAALEEVVMAMRTRNDLMPYTTGINTKLLSKASKIVSNATGFPVQFNKAVVGKNAFAHESGIHQDGVLKHRETYEIMRAQDVGWGANKISLGKLSGRNAFKNRLKELGIEIESNETFNATFDRFKLLADKKSEIFDEDIHALVSEEYVAESYDLYKLISLKTSSESGSTPISEIEITMDGKNHKSNAEGSGSVDAAFKAIELIVKSQAELLLFSVNNITSGTDSQGEVTVRLSKGGRIVNGQGSDTDIVIASAKAYISALNKLYSKYERAHPQV